MMCMVVAPTTGLARLSGSKAGEPKRVICSRPAHGWFTEGFDTAAMKSAEAFVRELA